MLDALADLIPFLRNSLLNDREKRVVAAVILISLPLSMFFIAFQVSSLILEERYAQQLQLAEYNRIKAEQERSPQSVVLPAITNYNAVEMAALQHFLSLAFERGNIEYAEKIARTINRRVYDDSFTKFITAKIHIQKEQFGPASEIISELESKDFMLDSLRTLRIKMASNDDLTSIAAEVATLSPTQLAVAAQRFMDLDNNAAARTFLDRAIQRDGANIEALFVLTNWYIGQKDFRNAERTIKKALEIDPLSSRVRGRYAVLLHETGKIKEAQEQYIAALRRNPNDYNLMFKLGELFFTELKDRNNARRYFERVIELAPNMWQAHLNLGVISMQENNVGAAIEEHFLTADRLSPRNLRILHLLAAAYERNNDRENALRTYERVLELNPLDDIALYKRRLLRQ